MLKVCQKNNCQEPAIKRGKYCKTHKTNKTKSKNLSLSTSEEERNTFINNYDKDIELAMKLSLEELNIEKQKTIDLTR